VQCLISDGREIRKVVVVQNILHQFLQRDLKCGDDNILDEIDDEVVELVEDEVEDVEISVELSLDIAQINDGEAQQSRLRTLLDGLDNFEGDADGLHGDVDGELRSEVHELGGSLVAADEVVDANRGADIDVSRVLVHLRQSGSVNGAESLQVSVVDLGGASDLDEEDFLGELEGFDGKNERIQAFVQDTNAEVLQDLISELVGISVVDVDDIVDSGADGAQTGSHQQNQGEGLHFCREEEDEDRPEGNDDGEGEEHNLLCNEIKGEDRAAAALDRYWRTCYRCYFLYRFCRWEVRNGRWVYQCYRRYRCYRKRCYGTCNCF